MRHGLKLGNSPNTSAGEVGKVREEKEAEDRVREMNLEVRMRENTSKGG